MLKLKNVSAGYGKKDVIKDINLSISKKELYILLGPNGSGKTTTFRVSSGILPPSRGSVLVKGTDIWEKEDIKSHIGYLPEGDRLYLDLSVYKNLLLFGNIYNANSRKIEGIIEKWGLEKYKNVKIKTLSSGYRKRVALARTTLHDPEILIFDEPFTNLDARMVIDLRNDILNFIENGKTVFLSTHILSELQTFEGSKCRVGIIKDGKIIFEEHIERVINLVPEIEFLFRVSNKDKTLKIMKKLGYDATEDKSGISVKVKNYTEEIPKLINIFAINKIDIYEVRSKETPLSKLYLELGHTDKYKK